MIIKTTKPLRDPLVSGSIISKLTSIQDPLNDPNFDFASEWTQVGQDIDGVGAYDEGGYSVALSDNGSILAIGSPDHDEGTTSDIGHVRVYENVNGQWQQLGGDINGETQNDLSGWSVDLNSDGTIVAIGARNNDGGGSNSGHVRVYQRDTGAPLGWTQIGQDINGEVAGDESGFRLSLNSAGTIVAIGARTNDGGGGNSGHVRVYENVSGTWQQLGDDIDGEAASDQSGVSLDLNSDGTIVAIGAPYNGGLDQGHVRVYENVDGTWQKIGGDIDGATGDNLCGYSVALSSDGSIVAVGSLRNDNNGTYSGNARVFQRDTGAPLGWTQLGGDINGEAAQDHSASDISLSSDGSILAIGAHLNDGNGADSGHVRVYQRDASVVPLGWRQIGSDIDGEAAGDRSGFRVSLNSDGSIVAIGAYYNDGSGPNSGHVRVYGIQ